MSTRLARFLTSLYPRAWRARYGEEFSALLEAQPLGLFTLFDVIGSAVLQQRHGAQKRLEFQPLPLNNGGPFLKQMEASMRHNIPVVFVILFFVVTGLFPQGVNIAVDSRLVNAQLDFDLQYVGVALAIGLVCRWRWARLCGLLTTWVLLFVLTFMLAVTLAAAYSGTHAFHFMILTSSLGGTSPLIFVCLGMLLSSYLYWQSRVLASPTVKVLFKGVV